MDKKTKVNKNLNKNLNKHIIPFIPFIPMHLRRSVVSKSGNRSKFAPELNRSEVARRVGVTRSHMSLIMSGKIKPTTDTLVKLGKVLGMESVDQVMRFLEGVREGIKVGIGETTK
jgi:transcriptional regulator with XRE-family HTH domain